MKCIYHSADFDGICSAAIIKYAYPSCDLIPYDYGKTFPWSKFTDEDEDVFMVDVSLPIADPDTGNDMINLDKKVILTWIDHHKTAMDDAEKHGFNPEGIRVVGKSGCELTWEYLFPETKMPEAVYLLGRYDVWDHADKPRALPFQYGMKVQNTSPTNQAFWSTLLDGRTIQRDSLVESIIRDGRLILEYSRNQDKIYSSVYSFETELNGHKVIAINRGLASSHLFEHVWDNKKYDIMLSFALKLQDNGKFAWRCTLYSDKPEIDVGIIAKTYGGGGHKGAAGFQCDNLPFSIEGK